MSFISRYESIKKAADLTLQEAKGFDLLVEGVLTRVIRDTLHTYQQKINVGIQDSVGDLLDTFKQKVAQQIFDTANTWKVVKREPVLFPRGCRFCSTKGESTIFVIEEDPQVRALSFAGGMMGSSRPSYLGNPEYISLALPYVLFIVHFRDGRFVGLYSGWRTHALVSLNDLMARPLLPNIHDNFNVCMGRSFTPSGQSMAEQSLNALNHFWNSTFNNDISDAWWSKFRLGNRLMTGRRWADESALDATFILQMNLNEMRSLQHQLNLLVVEEQEPDENVFRHKLSEGIDKCVGDLFAGTMRYFKKTKFERHEPKDITEVLRRAIKDAVGELVDVVFALDGEIKRLAVDVENHKQPVINGVGPYWQEYPLDIN